MQKKAGEIIVDEWTHMSSEIDSGITVRLNAWIDMYKSKGNEELTKRLVDIQTEIDNNISF
jgi:hypothetical protein